MDFSTYFKDKMSQMIFIEIGVNAIQKHLNTQAREATYIPIAASRLVDGVKKELSFDEIPISLLIEGMLTSLGCDEDFVYNNLYVKVLNNNLLLTRGFARKSIYDLIKDEKYLETYILLKGYVKIENSIENYEKLFLVAEKLRESDKEFEFEELKIIQQAKQVEQYPVPYFYEALIYYSNGEFRKAFDSVDLYSVKGGAPTEQILELKSKVNSALNYELGKEKTITEPETALKLLIPLIDEYEENALLFYHIAVAYRVIGNYEKAIYYLNESISIDSSYAEVIHELGLNYACIQDYKTAVTYFKKVFDATHSIEACTNLISCYISLHDEEQAKLYLNNAKKINPEDEIVIQLDEIMRGNRKWS